MEYGMPYMGSKSGIAKSICMNFPPADNFYDLFGGGGAITHCMALTKKKKFKHFHYNEINSCTTELLKRIIKGEFSYKTFKPPWVSREEFFAKKHTDAYIRCFWSFGNNQRNYIFHKDIEPYKRSMHMAVVFDEFDSFAKSVFGFDKWPSVCKTIHQKRIYLLQLINYYDKKGLLEQLKKQFKYNSVSSLKQIQPLEVLQRIGSLEQLARIERTQGLQDLGSLNFYSSDYRDVVIRPSSVVYCDIPYKNTSKYLNDFNHNEFYDWASSRPYPVYVSEYSLDDKRFECVYSLKKRVTLSATKDTPLYKQEKLFWNKVTL